MMEASRDNAPISPGDWRARAGATIVAMVCAFAAPLALAAPAAAIDLDDRVACQAVLEDLRWADMIWPESNPSPKPPREAMLADALIRERVLDRLRMEHALEELHGVRIETRDLQAELDRMVAQTRAPERLLERFRALGSDPHLIAECMARPELVRKQLTRRHHVDGKQNSSGLSQDTSAFEAWWIDNRHLWSPRLPPEPGSLRLPETAVNNMSLSKAAIADTWQAEHHPIGRADHRAIWTGTEMMVLGGWPFYWTGWSRYDPVSGIWKAASMVGAPDVDYGYYGYFAVWSGTEILNPGKLGNDWFLFRYDPFADAWKEPIPLDGLPSFEGVEQLVWTGSELLFLGPTISPGWGFRFTPESGEWRPMSTENAPIPRPSPSFLWTNAGLIVWGGGSTETAGVNTGGVYDPATDTWTPMTTSNAPTGRYRHTALWSGHEMIVVGGTLGGANQYVPAEDAGRYDPARNSWTPMGMDGAPELGAFVAAVWTGEEVVVFDGQDNTGARYTPVSDSWGEIATAAWMGRRWSPSVIWTGREMIVWGGSYYLDNGAFGPSATHSGGGRYDPRADRWTPVSEAALDSRSGAEIVWTGAEMLVWGGYDVGGDYHYPNSGARYDPATHAWVQMSTPDQIQGRLGAATVWTGKEMVVWGGYFLIYTGTIPGSIRFDDGARYDPLLDSWTATTEIGAPSARNAHSAIWTGTEMVIWGGLVADPPGARYDPAKDAWLPISISNAPEPTSNHNAIWTGDEMIVWHPGEAFQGRYSPEHDSWSPISTIGSPRAVNSRAHVWTGDEWIVVGWNPDPLLFDGARYAPATDEWTPVSTPDPSSLPYHHSAAWTDTHMILWGGSTGGHTPSLRSGIAYDPRTDTWASIADAPMAKEGHHAIWTGREIIVWGGYGHGGTLTYFPKSDTRTRIVASTPNPTMPGLPVRVRVHVTAADTAPRDGQVQLSSTDGAACLDLEPQAFDAQTAAFECALSFDSLGTHRVDALFSASDTHYDSDTLSNLGLDASAFVVVVPLIEDIFADGFELAR